MFVLIFYQICTGRNICCSLKGSGIVLGKMRGCFFMAAGPPSCLFLCKMKGKGPARHAPPDVSGCHGQQGANPVWRRERADQPTRGRLPAGEEALGSSGSETGSSSHASVRPGSPSSPERAPNQGTGLQNQMCFVLLCCGRKPICKLLLLRFFGNSAIGGPVKATWLVLQILGGTC